MQGLGGHVKTLASTPRGMITVAALLRIEYKGEKWKQQDISAIQGRDLHVLHSSMGVAVGVDRNGQTLDVF